jgi:hypothetical protein
LWKRLGPGFESTVEFILIDAGENALIQYMYPMCNVQIGGIGTFISYSLIRKTDICEIGTGQITFQLCQ